MPEKLYKPKYGKLMEPDISLVGAGEQTLDTVGYAQMKLVAGSKYIFEKVYLIKGGHKSLLGSPGIRSFGLIDNIPGTYSIRAVDTKDELPLKNSVDSVRRDFPKLFSGLGKLRGHYTIRLQDGVNPF